MLGAQMYTLSVRERVERILQFTQLSVKMERELREFSIVTCYYPVATFHFLVIFSLHVCNQGPEESDRELLNMFPRAKTF
jgi:hypothetical protein